MLSAAMSIRIAIVEDETMVADMLKAWLSRRPQIEVVSCAADGTTALALCRKQRPDIALVDIQLPDMNGLDLSEHLLKELPALKIIIVSCRSNPYCLVRAEEVGVHGYVDKMSPLPLLEKAIRAVAAGERCFSETVGRELKREQRNPGAFNKVLTEREREIIGLITLGLSDAEVGTQLDISPETVGLHRRNAGRKLDISNDRSRLIRLGRKLGLEFSVNNLRIAAAAGQARRTKST
jgi:DNA-binding NarL/FixJ family response regulator